MTWQLMKRRELPKNSLWPKISCQTAQEPREAPRKKAVLIWWDFLETEWMFSKRSITCLTIFECYYQQLELKDFFFLISAVHWRFYLNCSYKKLMKALSCWATKWQEWIPVRWNLLKIQLSKHFCINVSWVTLCTCTCSTELDQEEENFLQTCF